MPCLSISLLGPFQAERDGLRLVGFKSNKVRALLAYLAGEADRPHPRETLAGLLWPEWSNTEALGNLRYALSNLRTVIGDQDAHPPFLLITRESIHLNPAGDTQVDAIEFARTIDIPQGIQPNLDQLESAVSWYRGPFLDGFYLSDSPVFEDWIVITRERYTRRLLSALHTIAGLYEQRGMYDRAQTYAWRQLEVEPCDESAHQQLIRALALGGQRSAALAQYESCRSLLSKELGVTPSEETTRLYETICQDKLKPASQPSADTPLLQATLPPFLLEAPPAAEQPVFVARQGQLEQLDRFLKSAVASKGQVVFVTGEAGSGKTSLLQEFTQYAQNASADLCVVYGNCNAYTGIGDPYLPFREILELLTGDVEARLAAGAITPEHARRLWKLIPASVQALLEHGPDLIDTFIPRLALSDRAIASSSARAAWLSTLDKELERKPAHALSAPAFQQSDLFEQYTKVLQTLSQKRPLLLILDDLQWADLGSISLLFHLGRRLSGYRVLILGAYRPEEVAIGAEGERHPLESVINEFRRLFGDIEVNVESGEGREFIDAYLDCEPNHLGSAFRQMLHRQTQGQPLFTIELLRGLQERGDILRDPSGYWIEGQSLDWETFPARVEAAIRERIDRLPAALRRALAVASVEGEDFTAEVVAWITSADERKMVQLLSDDLVRKHRLVRPQAIRRLASGCASRYRFQHILFQKYLYTSLDKVERVYLHEQVGTALETLYTTPDESAAIAVQLALHFQKARITGKAIHYLQLAGERAVRFSAYQEGKAHLARGLAMLLNQPDSPQRAEQELELQITLGMAWMGDIPGPQWERALTRARQLCHQLGKSSELCLVLGQLSIFHYVRAEYRPAHQLAEEALALARQTGENLLVALTHWFLGFILFGQGQYAEAHRHLEQVIAFYDPQQHHRAFVDLHGSDAGVSAMAYDACCLWCLGFQEDAEERSRAALDLARQLGHAFTLADVLCFGGCLYNQLRGDLPELLKCAEELRHISQKMGFSSFEGTGMCHQGEALTRLGHAQEGLPLIYKGLAIRQEIGARCHMLGFLGALAEAQSRVGQPESGLATLEEAIAQLEETDERHWEVILYRLKGELLLALGHRDEAETCLRKAIFTAQAQGVKFWELEVEAILSQDKISPV